MKDKLFWGYLILGVMLILASFLIPQTFILKFVAVVFIVSGPFMPAYYTYYSDKVHHTTHDSSWNNPFNFSY